MAIQLKITGRAEEQPDPSAQAVGAFPVVADAYPFHNLPPGKPPPPAPGEPGMEFPAAEVKVPFVLKK